MKNLFTLTLVGVLCLGAVGFAQQPPATPNPAKAERTPREVLDNPQLTLDKPPDDGFDPYNTGAFNRSASWERIGRQRKR